MHAITAAPICHIEIPAPDLVRAKRFYEAVFGWKVQVDHPDPDYWFFSNGNTSGGFNRNSPLHTGGVNLYLRVPDVEEALDRVESYGGTVLEERQEVGEDYGYYAVFRDPNGNRMSLWGEA